MSDIMRNIRARERYWANHEEKKAKATAWRQANRHRTRWYQNKYKYGMTAEDFAAMWNAQLGLCPICLCSLDNAKQTHIDHSHTTQKVRGILCFNCNNGLGAFRDNVERLRRAADYVEKRR